MSIRNAAKAIIVDHGKMLLNKNRNTVGDMCNGLPNGSIYYDLPGGGQNQYETLEEAVRRECLEEAGCIVAVERLAAVYEEISMNDRFRREYPQYAHKVHFVFVCHLTDAPMTQPCEKDLDMLGSEWVGLEDMKNIPLYPRIIHERLATIINSKTVLYLGSERVP